MTSALETDTELSAELDRIEAGELHRQAVERLADIDEALAELLVRRTKLSCEIARAKLQMGMPIYNGEREREVVASFVEISQNAGLPLSMARTTIESIIVESRRVQSELGNRGGGVLSAEAAQDIIEQVRTGITEIDAAFATLLGERQMVMQALAEAELAGGGTAYRQDEGHELNDMLELVEAGGVRREWARDLLVPYIATVRL